MKGNQNENESAPCIGGYVSSFILEADLLPCWNNKPIDISSKIALKILFLFYLSYFCFLVYPPLHKLQVKLHLRWQYHEYTFGTIRSQI